MDFSNLRYTGLNIGTSPREKYCLKDTNTVWLDTWLDVAFPGEV